MADEPLQPVPNRRYVRQATRAHVCRSGAPGGAPRTAGSPSGSPAGPSAGSPGAGGAHLPLSLSRTRKAGDLGPRSPALHFFPPRVITGGGSPSEGTEARALHCLVPAPLCRRAVGEWAPAAARQIGDASRQVQSASASARCKGGAATLRAEASAQRGGLPDRFIRVSRTHPGVVARGGSTRPRAKGATRRTQPGPVRRIPFEEASHAGPMGAIWD